MKKFFLLTMLGMSLPVLTMAQDDDLYFVPSKETKVKEVNTYGMPTDTYYSGSKRSAREYNRRSWDTTASADTTANDIIDFSAVEGVYPDTTATVATEEDSDYSCTRKMSRFDGYTPSEAYWEGYRDGTWTSGRPGWYSAWYGSWYGPWYSLWLDPWYDSWYFGSYWGSPYYYAWYSPWRYDYYYWSRPYWGWGGGYYAGSATRPWSRAGYSHHKYLTARGDGARRSSSMAGYRVPRTTSQTYGTRGMRSNAGNLGGYRSRTYNNNSNNTPSYNRSFSGGSRSSMGNGGGYRPSGGGRSAGGGHNYGGRR